jgi:predicted transposase/invertase (TIGR01784 family)
MTASEQVDLRLDKGLLRGMELGLERGLERGMEKGKLETARNMLKFGSEPSFIEKVTGLPIESIMGIQKG